MTDAAQSLAITGSVNDGQITFSITRCPASGHVKVLCHPTVYVPPLELEKWRAFAFKIAREVFDK